MLRLAALFVFALALADASFAPGPELNVARIQFASAVCAGKLCVFGGLRTSDAGNHGEALASIECLDLTAANASWRLLHEKLPEPLFAQTAVTLRNGSVLVIGGRNGSQSTTFVQSDHVLVFDPAAETLRRGARLPYAVSSAVAVLSAQSGRVFVTFGWHRNDVCRRTVAFLDEGAERWNVSAQSRYSHCDHGAFLGPDERVFMFAGAADEAPALNTMNEFESKANTFRLWFKLTDARDLVMHASPMPGVALAIGGRDPEMSLWSSVERLNVTVGWGPAGFALPVPLAGGAAHFVNATTLCVVGGFSTALHSLASMWCRTAAVF